MTKEAGFPLFSILGIVFIVLKLADIITWSWWWVLCPFWGPFAFVLVVFIIAALLGAHVVVRKKK